MLFEVWSRSSSRFRSRFMSRFSWAAGLLACNLTLTCSEGPEGLHQAQVFLPGDPRSASWEWEGLREWAWLLPAIVEVVSNKMKV